MSVPLTRAVFFDVDFTLIRPGPAFEGIGYRDFCARHGVDVDASAFDSAVAAAAPLLDADGGPTIRRSSSSTPVESSKAWVVRVLP